MLGGNLAVLTALIGTPAFPPLDDAVLFLEDVNERPYRVDRMLTTWLPRTRFAACARSCWARSSWASRVATASRSPTCCASGFRSSAIPVVAGLPAGHVDDNAELPFGRRVTLDANVGRLYLQERRDRLEMLAGVFVAHRRVRELAATALRDRARSRRLRLSPLPKVVRHRDPRARQRGHRPHRRVLAARSDDVAVYTAFVTVYAHPAALAAEVRGGLTRMPGYTVTPGEVAGQYVWMVASNDPERFCVWPSGPYLVKLGAPEAAPFPDQIAEAYASLYPSDLDEHGNAREETASYGEAKSAQNEEAEPAIPASLREGAPR